NILAGAAGGVLLALAVLAQGLSLLWRRTRPVGVLAVCLAAYAINSAVVPGVPPYAGWFALYAAGVYTRPARRATFAGIAGAAGFTAVIGVGAVVYPAGAGG